MPDKIVDTEQPLTVITEARRLYEAYGDNSDRKSWNGLPMPTWEELNSAVRSHWCAVVIATRKVMNPNHALAVDVVREHRRRSRHEQTIESLCGTADQLAAFVLELVREAEAWKAKAARHGCNVEGGDIDCG